MRLLGGLGLHQAVEREFTVFLLVALAMIVGAELSFRQALEQRQLLTAVQAPHQLLDRPFLSPAKG
jgi:hypothetical protein